MEDNFPRIYSLSTIGIKQHFNCDYRFHPLRTDFSGESGSGKSMIADMIQLVLVGSGVYKSSTDSNKSRDIKGMVIESKGKQNGRGYILLNIETYHSKFITIGAYLESSHNQVQLFIIQGGYDWDTTLTPMIRPIYYQDLLIDNKVESVEGLQDKLENISLKVLQRKKYHQLLYENSILAFDLNQDKRTLESYASILRSFSRGKGFQKDSESLKKFLFGDDDQNKLEQRFQEEVKAINNDFLEHERYKKEIELINNKQKLIEDVSDSNKKRKELQLAYLTDKNLFWNTMYEHATKKHEVAENAFIEALIQNKYLEIKEVELQIEEIKLSCQNLDKYQKELSQINKEKDSFSETYHEAKNTFQIKQKQNDKIEKVKEWLKGNKDEIETVKQWFLEEKAKSEKKRLLNEFITHLKNQNQLISFENSLWLKDYNKALNEYDNCVNDFENKIKALKALSVFTNLDNPQSLAGWARTNLKFPLSHETESVLVYFQILPRELNEESVKRYLPFPKDLFENLDIKGKTDKEFWINLDGVYELIEYIPIQYLNTDKPENLVELLHQLTEGVKGDLSKAVKEKNEIINLRKALFSFPNVEQAIPLFSDRVNIQQLNPHSISELTETDFSDLLITYNEKDRFLNEFSEAEKAFEEILKKKSTFESSIKDLNDKIEEAKTYLNENYPNENPNYLVIRKEKQVLELQKNLEEIENSSSYNTFKVQKVKDSLFLYNFNLLRVTQLKAENVKILVDLNINKENAERELAQAKSKLEEAKQEYFIAFNHHFDFSTTDAVKHNPEEGNSSLKSQYEKAKLSFETKYELAIEDLEDKAQLEGGYSIGLLAHKLLPTVFESSRIDEDLVSQHIAERLAKLTRDIQEIGSRKVEILKRVFTEVHKTYNEYLEKINGIDTYLKSKERGITGGNRASLRHTKSVDYPDKWMAPFRKQLDEQLYKDGLFASLVNEVDINEIMMKAFRAAGGSTKVTHEDLLNPKSYFDLEFDLKMDSGESNAGSSGQTYTANALLGLARLSLIEDAKRNGIRIMPIDEAEGLGSNYNMLHKLAKREKYQVVSMSIETAGNIEDGEQYIYIMNENNISDGDSYVPPLGIFSDNKITEDISISNQHDV